MKKSFSKKIRQLIFLFFLLAPFYCAKADIATPFGDFKKAFPKEAAVYPIIAFISTYIFIALISLYLVLKIRNKLKSRDHGKSNNPSQK